MQTFVAMLLTLRVGLVPSPTEGAVLSIRDEALASARVVAARDTFVGREPARVVPPWRRRQPATSSPNEWGPPATVHVLRKEDWRDLIAQTLNGNQTIANAAIWIASAPVRLRVSQEKVFVAITLRTP